MTETCVDFVLPDVARLRLVNANAGDVAAVQRQIGPLRTETPGQPDIVLRFFDRLPGQDGMRILGNWEVGYSADAFWLLRGAHGFPIAVQIPLDRVGMPCEILCRHSFPALPLLGSILNLCALNKGLLPLHASAFVFAGESVLVTGWCKGGKTEALLGFAEQGATYVGDEWVYIDPVKETMRGVPQPIHLWDWHLDCARHRSRLTKVQRFKLAALRYLQQSVQPLVGWQTPLAKAAQRTAEFIKRRRHVRLTPQRLFADRVQSVAPCPARVIFMASHAAPTIEINTMPIDEIAARMAISLEEEFSALNACYRQFQFAFPDRTNPLLEQLPSLLKQRLAEAFQGKTGLAVWHPYPVSPNSLFQAMCPHVQKIATELPARRRMERWTSTKHPHVRAAL
jgi:hypothetical protein